VLSERVQILSAAFITTPEGFTVASVDVQFLVAFLAFLVRAVAISQPQGGLESTAKVALVVLKNRAIRGVAFLLYI
jgi:hypothetical protein